MKSTRKLDDHAIANANWARYIYVRDRGHIDFCINAIRTEDLYLGGGTQFTEEDKQVLREMGRHPIEINEIADSVDTAVGYQINNRVDIVLRPKRNATDKAATKMTKLAMQIKDNLRYEWHETQVFTDGTVQQRGYFDLRVNYDQNMNGEISLFTYDPLDVIPDPDSKSYNPDDWADVTTTRWMTLDDIEVNYGKAKRTLILSEYASVNEDDFGDDDEEGSRNKFGLPKYVGSQPTYDALDETTEIKRVRVIDRQHWKMENSLIAVMPTGDIRVLNEANPHEIENAMKAGALTLRKPMKRVWWTVSTQNVLLMNELSPYKHFTVIPYFYTFRRGRTRSMVDQMVGPQELLNSCVTMVAHIVKSTANSGWIVEQNSLTNMDTDDLETEGAKTGLLIEHAKGTKAPEKIKPNEIPQGVSDLINLGSFKIKGVSGQTDAMRGQGGKDQSGLAAQSQQFAAQMSQAIHNDNLAYTRNIFTTFLIELIQSTMTEPQILRITEMDKNGMPASSELPIHMPDEEGDIFDPTAGEYDLTISTQPSQITFQNSQYNQALELRKVGVMIPDGFMIKNSNLADKADIIEQMQAQQPAADPTLEAKAALMEAQAVLARANAAVKSVEALFSAARTAQVISAQPGLAPVADAIALSSGYVDQNAAPIFPADQIPTGIQAPPASTNPATPDNPQTGATSGIENGNPEGVVP